MFSRRSLTTIAFAIAGFVASTAAFAQSKTAPARPSQDYVAHAAVNNMFRIQSSKLALSKSGDANVKSYASGVIKDQTAASAKLKKIIKAEELPLVPATKLDDTHQQMIDSLSSASGRDFDKMYGEMQTKAHEEALTLHQGYAENGMEPKLKAFAKTTGELEQHSPPPAIDSGMAPEPTDHHIDPM